MNSSPIKSQKRVFTGNVVRVDQVELEFENHNQATFELISFDVETGVSALPLIDDQIILIKHYQLGIDKIGYSLPTGGLKKGEDPKERMQQELQQEIGFKAGKLKLLARINTIPGYIGNKPVYLYLAQDLTPSKMPGDEPYPIKVIKVSFDSALKKIKTGEIKDSRTILAMLFYQQFYR